MFFFNLSFDCFWLLFFDEGNNKFEGKKNKGFIVNVINDEVK